MTAVRNKDKINALGVMLFFNVAQVCFMSYSRNKKTKEEEEVKQYLASTAVFLSETLKILVCTFVDAFHSDRSVLAVWEEAFEKPEDYGKMLIPAFAFTAQSNLLLFAVSVVDVAVYQVVSQTKILVTGVFSVVLLNKKLSYLQWFSLFILMCGVCVIQLSSKETDAKKQKNENSPLGLVAIIISSISSGFVGVYFEKVVKASESPAKPPPSIWIRNIQLSLFGGMFSLINILFLDYAAVYERGFFQEYDIYTVIVIVLMGCSGISVALVIKYADNILKCFASSVAIILTTMVSVYFFDFQPTMQFYFGTVLVLCAVLIYNKFPPEARPAVAMPNV